MPIMLTKLILITTYRCDLNCQHCLQGFPKEQSGFPAELLDKLLTEAMPFGAHHVTLTGGEAYLHPRFEYIVETIVRYGYTWSLISNGQKIEPYLPLMETYRKQIKSVGLSLDGAIPELHDELRGQKGAFEKVVTSAKAYTAHGFEVWIKTTLNQKNKMHLEALSELAANLGARGIIFGGTIPFAWNQQLILRDIEALELYRKILSLRINSPVEIHYTRSLYTHGGVNFCDRLNLNELSVSPRGNVDFCCNVNQSKGAIGSLKNSSMLTLV
jgi:MoaA/NifB/PqqE/SkfB family radical SAM enzyme